jgi:hypothetical protein
MPPLMRIAMVDRALLATRAGRVGAHLMARIDAGLRLVLELA